MSENHGEAALQKPISEYAECMKNLIPANIPDTYTVKPIFKKVASEENIRNGIIAFRDFLYTFCDKLVSDGDLYSKPQKTKNTDDYPFLNNINQLLIAVGYHGKLNKSGDSLTLNGTTSFINQKPKIPASKQLESLRFLTLCGFIFSGVDLEAKTVNIAETQSLEVLYPKNPILLTGLKVLSIAAVELWVRFYNNACNLFRCDYRVIKAEDTDILDILKDFLNPLPKKLQNFALELHKRYTDMGMTCVTLNDDSIHFAYSYTKNSKRKLSIRETYQARIWEFNLSTTYGYCLLVRAKRTDKYADVIEKFPSSLKEKIAKGYGCDRKRGEPCQGGCLGTRIPFDNSILDIKDNIVTWLDNEMPKK